MNRDRRAALRACPDMLGNCSKKTSSPFVLQSRHTIVYNTSTEMAALAPSYKGLKPASTASSRAMRGNRSVNTRHEALLGLSLQRLGLHAAHNVTDLPGRPDLVFRKAQVAIFCDGDFWHGRNWTALRKRLAHRVNAEYWIAKITYNIRRDAHQRQALRRFGWKVLRFWESDITQNPQEVADRIHSVVRERLGGLLRQGDRGKVGARS